MTTPYRERTGGLPARLALVLCLLGTAISAYLTYEHSTDSRTLACSGTGAVNCLKVTTSQWSQIAGVPVAVAGLAFFLAMTLLCAPTRFAAEVGLLRLVGVLFGTAMVLWLIYVEIFLVEAICSWCTAVHVVTVALLAPSCGGANTTGCPDRRESLVLRDSQPVLRPNPSSAASGCVICTLTSAVVRLVSAEHFRRLKERICRPVHRTHRAVR